MRTGGDPVVPEPGGAARHQLRHPPRHLVLRLHLCRAVHAQAPLPRPVRGRPARQDLLRPRHAAGERVAGGLVGVAQQLCLRPPSEPRRPHPRDGS